MLGFKVYTANTPGKNLSYLRVLAGLLLYGRSCLTAALLDQEVGLEVLSKEGPSRKWIFKNSEGKNTSLIVW